MLVNEYRFETPSSIQQRAIKPMLMDRDVVAQAQSGTGKTATFAIAVLNKITPEPVPQAIIIAPTRELADQISNVVSALGQHLGIKVAKCIGGISVGLNIRELQGAQVAVGTPGRLKDMITRGSLPTTSLRMCVVDEADEVLSQGFSDEVVAIFNTLPSTTQIALISATLSGEVLAITQKILTDPIRVLVKTEEVTLEGIKQFYINVGKREYKFDTLTDLYETIAVVQAIIFCNTRRQVQELEAQMKAKDFTVSCIVRHPTVLFCCFCVWY